MWVRSSSRSAPGATYSDPIHQQIVVLTSTTLEVYDINTCKLVEHVLFDAWSLVSPVLSHTINGSMSYTDAVTEVSHSVRVYKGKIFLLVSHPVDSCFFVSHKCSGST